jgi:hypothetical protein
MTMPIMNIKPIYQIIRRTFLAVLLAGVGTLPAHAQYTFDSGSNGSYGAMNITADTTLAMPNDGTFHCTSITVAAGATLKFTPNSLNTPVYLLATGDVTISGTIDVNGSQGGAAGPGGFAGGKGDALGLSPGDGHGPGAGKSGSNGGSAAYGTVGGGDSGHGNVYGSVLLVPMVGGSGGGASTGSGGGGAILIASNSRIDVDTSGIIFSNGGAGASYGGYEVGSGGAIRLLAPVVAGDGALYVQGGQVVGYDSYAGNGRIRIDCMDRRSVRLRYYPDSTTVSLGANMMTFPPNPPHLDITQAAGTNIPVGTGNAVSITLPQDSAPNRTVTVQATNFGKVIPIRVVLTPDNGSSVSYDAEIDNSAVGSASMTVNVVVPVNVQVHVEAWTR